MKIYKLDREEKEIIKATNRGEYEPILDPLKAEKKRQEHIAYANAFLKKDTKINIRLNKQDLELIRMKAREEGMPYQTLIGSILHKYAHR